MMYSKMILFRISNETHIIFVLILPCVAFRLQLNERDACATLENQYAERKMENLGVLTAKHAKKRERGRWE